MNPKLPGPIALAATAVALLLSACVFSPRTVNFDDPNCQGVKREMVLDSRVLEGYKQCNTGSCSPDAVLMGAIGSTATFVVSGSIYVIGNVVYWIEKQLNCR